MRGESTCRCLICNIEATLVRQLAEHDRQECYQQFAGSRSLLSVFPSASDLIAYLHSRRNAENGTSRAESVLCELLQAAVGDGDTAPLREMLVLAFIPTLHATSRWVAASYPSLPPEDIAQHAVASLLEVLHGSEFHGRSSYVAFSISRLLKRNTFSWAHRESRFQRSAANPELIFEAPSNHDSSEPIERTAVLGHLLSRCEQRGWLTSQEMELLVQFKFEDAKDATPRGPGAVHSNASRQRVKRVVGKLRRIARTPLQKDKDHGQGSLF